MVDVIDEAEAKSSLELQSLLAQARHDAASIPKGYAGNCECCGSHSKRLVNGACAYCRDEFKLD